MEKNILRTIVTKKRYAQLKGRTQAAVSNWIANGQITRAALIGYNVRARIWVEQADRELAANLDPVQQYAQEYTGRPPANRSCL